MPRNWQIGMENFSAGFFLRSYMDLDLQQKKALHSSFFRFLKNKLKEKGIVYCISTGSRLSFELLDMITIPTRKKILICIDSTKFRINKRDDTLFAFYDLAGSPASFDILTFLILAEHSRIVKKCKNLHVFIIPGPNEGFSPNALKTYQIKSSDQKNANIAYMNWRMRNILVPACWLVSSCNGITVCSSRDEALALESSIVEHRFPENYSVHYPSYNYLMTDLIILANSGVPYPSISAPESALNFIKIWLDIHANNRKTIVITLRESSYRLSSNSNLNNWEKFAKNIDTSIFCPIIIRDTEKVFEPLPSGFATAITFPEICFNIELRAALYELCYLNMTVEVGTVTLCMFNKNTKYLLFKRGLTPGARTDLKNINVELGTQPSICSSFQKWVWEDDTYEAIEREFHEMVEKIDNSVKK